MPDGMGLNLEIRSNADNAIQRLNELASSLDRISKASGKSKLGSTAKALDQIKESGQRAVQSTEEVAEGLEKSGSAAERSSGRMKRLAQALSSMSFSSFAGSIKSLASHFSPLTGTIKSITSGFGSLTRRAGIAVKSGINWVASSVRKAASAFSEMRSKISLSNTALGTLVNSVKRIAFYRLIRAGIKMATEGVNTGIENLYRWSDAMNGSFAASMDTGASASLKFKNSIGAMLGPAIEAVIPLLVQLANIAIQAANAINQFISVLFGRSTWTRAKDVTTSAYKALGGAGKKAKEADDAIKGLLADWDELNIIQQESSKKGSGGSGGGGGGGIGAEDMFEQVEIENNWWTDLAQQLKDAIKAGDWEGAGRILGDKLNEVIARWDSDGWARKFNDVVNKALRFSIGLLDSLNFKLLGAKIGLFMIEIFGDNNLINWQLLGTFLRLKIMAAFNTLYGLFETPGLFEGIGKSLAAAVNKLFEFSQDNINVIAEVLGGSIKRVATAAVSFFDETDFESIGSTVGDILRKVFGKNGSIGWDTIGEALRKGFTSVMTLFNALVTGKEYRTDYTGNLGYLMNKFNAQRNDFVKGNNMSSGIGEGIASMINSAFDFSDDDIKTAADTFAKGIGRIAGEAVSFLKKADFEGIGTKVNEFLGGIFGPNGNVNWMTVGEALRQGVLAAFGFLNGLINAGNLESELGGGNDGGLFAKIGESVANTVNKFFDFSADDKQKIVDTLNASVKDALEGIERFFTTTNWDKIGEDVQYWIENLDYAGIASAFWDALRAAFEAGESILDHIMLGIYNSLAEAWNKSPLGKIDKAPLFGDAEAFGAWTGQDILSAVGLKSSSLDSMFKADDGKYYKDFDSAMKHLGRTATSTKDDLKEATDQVEAAKEALAGSASSGHRPRNVTGKATAESMLGTESTIANGIAEVTSGAIETAKTEVAKTAKTSSKGFLQTIFDALIIDDPIQTESDKMREKIERWFSGMYKVTESDDYLTYLSKYAEKTGLAFAHVMEHYAQTKDVFGSLPVSEWPEYALSYMSDDYARQAADEIIDISEEAAEMASPLTPVVEMQPQIVDGNAQDYTGTYEMEYGLGNGETLQVTQKIKPIVEVDQSEIEGLYDQLYEEINFYDPSESEISDAGFWESVLEPLVRDISAASGITEEATDGVANQFHTKWLESLYAEDWEGSTDGLLNILSESIEEAIPDELKAPDSSAYESSLNNAANATVSTAGTAINALNQWNAAKQSLFGGGGFWSSVGSAIHNLPGFASGGYPTTGQMFIAREAGPEYVGTMNGRTAVANNDQIVSGVASGVAAGQAEQNALLRQQNDYLRQLLAKESTVKIVPSSALGRVNMQSAEMYARQTGG